MTAAHRAWIIEEVLALPAVIDLRTAAGVLGMGATKAYELARRGEFPVRTLRFGTQYRVPLTALLVVLGIDRGAAPHSAATADLTNAVPTAAKLEETTSAE